VAQEINFTFVGQTLHYTLVATNDGDVTLTNVTITDAKLGSLTCTPPQPATLDPQASMTCTGTYVTTQADADAGKVDNTANASGTWATIPVTAPPASATVPFIPDPQLNLTKVVTEASFTTVGETLHYTLVAKNVGNVTLVNVSITDTKLGTLTCTPAQPVTLNPQETLTCTGTYVTTQADVDAGRVDNTAYAAGTYGTTPIPAPPATTTIPSTGPDPRLSLIKKVQEASFYKVGQTLHYTLVATNDGNVTLTNVTITDAKLGVLACTPEQPATLPPKSKLSCAGSYVTTQADVDAKVVNNTAYASGINGTTPVTAPPASATVPYKKKPKPQVELPSTGFTPNRVTKLPLQSARYAALGDLWLEIPRLGVKTSIVGVPQTDSGWNVSWLGDQAGWLNGTAFPTWAGNSILTAHVYDAFGHPGPFVHINDLVYGDRIIVHVWGGSYSYAVQQVIQVAPDAVSSVIKHEELPWVTLLTCRGYDQASNSYKYRLAVRAVLVEVK
jgi:LPXTG-site transpeptidase (sortase) family protein